MGEAGSDIPPGEAGMSAVTARRLWWTEFVSAFLLGLAAVSAGWAAYQAARWGGQQAFALNRAITLGREATFLKDKATLLKMLDVNMFTTYLEAVSHKNERFAKYVLDHFRPPMKTAVNAWLALRPFENPSAPGTPFNLPQYHLPEEDESERINGQEAEQMKWAQYTNTTSDNYVLMTIPFAVVSLFSGISTKFGGPEIRMAIVAMALVIYIVATVVLAFMPVAQA